VFDALRRADDGGVARVCCRRSMHAIRRLPERSR
jgi:DNA-directed RNA polymerase subunit N (RpoN/RPB10)